MFNKLLLLAFTAILTMAASAQPAPFDVFPDTHPPYYRVRYEGSTKPGELIYAVKYTIWLPPGVKTLRGIIVHQHGCGEGAAKQGLTGAFDLHWQALAKKHGCALISPSYEQPTVESCGLWADPRNGSEATFLKSLADLGAMSDHPELSTVPWALWGHSGGGTWAGGMTFLHPERVAALWLRSGPFTVKPNPDRSQDEPHEISPAVLTVPIMCNQGTKEGISEKDGRFASVWPRYEILFNTIRSQGGFIGHAVDPLTGHECGNQRYLAIPWLDACLTARLPKKSGDPLKSMPTRGAWLAPLLGTEAVPFAQYSGKKETAVWLPNQAIAEAWMSYIKDTAVPDNTRPPRPTNVRIDGAKLTWEVEADLESGLAHFIIERDGQFLAKVPENGENKFGRPIFQNLQYGDTPTQPLVEMKFTDTTAKAGEKHRYRVIAVNTVGLKSK